MSRLRPVLFLLLVAAVLPYFIGLGTSSIWDANEAFYVETPREMIERGDFVIPTFNYEPRLNKPVLSYWIVAAFYQVFGVSVVVQRVAIALGAMVVIATAFVLANAAAPRRDSRLETGDTGPDTRAFRLGIRDSGFGEPGLWAAVGLAVDPRLLMFARRIFIDIYLTMFMGLTLLCFALAERYPARRRTCLALMYAFVGLGVLTKGPIAAALPGLVFAIYLLMHRELKRIREMMLPAGALIVLAIVVPWYAALYARDGWTYIWSFFVGENIGRYTEGVGEDQRRGALFYLPVLFSDAFPWALFLPASAVLWLSELRSRRPEPDRRVRTLLWLWVVVIVAFFSFSRSKQDLYIFPVLPAVAALAGAYVARAERGIERRWKTGLRVTAATIAVLFGLGGAGVLYVFQSAGTVYALDGAALIGSIAVAGGITAVAAAVLFRPRAALVIVLAALVSLNWLFVLRVLPSFERYKPVPPLTAVLQQHAASDAVVAHYEVSLPSMVYYLRRHIDMYFEREPFLATMRSSRPVYAILSAEDYEMLQPEFGVQTCVLHRQPTINVKLRAVIAREPLPELLLITNTCE